MKQVLMIPDCNRPMEAIKLAQQYHLGFEYNDFFEPAVLDDQQRQEEVIQLYQSFSLPEYCTLHGAFFDVIPFSPDAKIKEISHLRINQSMDIAKRLGAKGVVFHTNYNPFLNTSAYVQKWIEQNIAFWSDMLQRNPQISIYLENMFDTTPDLLYELSDALSKYQNYGICLDYAHAAISKTAPDEWAKRLGRFVKHIHINDNDLVSDLHLAWGDGKMDRMGFYRSYEEYMGDASVLVEMSSMEYTKRSLDKLIEEGFI